MARDEQTTLGDLEAGKPTRDDPIEEGADHIRQLKRTLKRSFAGFDGTVLLQGVVAREGADSGIYPVRIEGLGSVVLTAGSLLLFQADEANPAHARVHVNQQVLMPWVDAAKVALSAGRVRAGEWTLSVYDGAVLRLLSQADVAGLTTALEKRVDDVEREARTREASLTQQVEGLGKSIRQERQGLDAAVAQAKALADRVSSNAAAMEKSQGALEAQQTRLESQVTTLKASILGEFENNYSALLTKAESRQDAVEAQAKAASEQAESAEAKAQSALTKADSNQAAIKAHGLPEQRDQAGHYLTTDGSQAAWRALPSVDEGALKEAVKADLKESFSHELRAAAGKLNAVESKAVSAEAKAQTALTKADSNRAAIEAHGLPEQRDQAGHYLMTDGAQAAWRALPASSSVDEGALKDAVKADLKESFSQTLRAAEEKLNAVESRQNEVEAQAKAASEQAESAGEKAQSALTKAESNRAAIEAHRLPEQRDQAGHYLTTDGRRAAWRALPASSVVDEGALKEAVKADLKASFSHELRAAEEKLNAVEQEVAQAEGKLTGALETERGRINRNRRRLNVLDSQVESHTRALAGVNDRLLAQAVIPRRWTHYQLLRAAAVNDGANFRWEVPRGVYQVGVACWGAGGKQAYEVGYAGAGGAGFAFGVFGVEPGQLLGGFRVGTDGNDGMTVYGEYLQAHRGGDAVYRDFVSIPGEGGVGVVNGEVTGALVARGGRGGEVIQQMPSDDEGAKPTQHGELLVTVGGGGGGA
ncbi:MAG: hypothetical protein KUF78_18795, partial [Candidatus Thiodiazotropha sp. (ex Lucina aurantia)]|nr:hypothetical protein [Candidatus Thiodiazotropha sp. (ex Lucina aurantia)]